MGYQGEDFASSLQGAPVLGGGSHRNVDESRTAGRTQFVLFAKPIHPLQLLGAIRDLCPEALDLSDDHLRGVVGRP